MTSSEVRNWFDEHNVELVTYKDFLELQYHMSRVRHSIT